MLLRVMELLGTEPLVGATIQARRNPLFTASSPADTPSGRERCGLRIKPMSDADKPTAILRALVADRHPLYRAALAQLIANSAEFELVGEAEDWAQAETEAGKLTPDLALLALNLPGLREHLPTADLLRRMRTRRTILVIDEVVACEALEVLTDGGYGYISKGWPEDRISEVLNTAAQELAGNAANGSTDAVLELTPRERQTVELMSCGATNPEIATELAISLSTVKGHVAAAMRKLRARNRAEVVAMVIHTGLPRGARAHPPRV